MRISRIDIVSLVLISLIMNCCSSQSSLESSVTQHKLDSLIQLIQTDPKHKSISKHCNELDAFVDRTGAVYSDMIQKNIQSSSYKNSQTLFKVFRLCTINQYISTSNKQQIQKQIQRVVKGIMLNSVNLDQYSAGFFEKRDNLQHLIEILIELEQLSQLIDIQDYIQKRNQYMFYVYQNRFGLVAQGSQYKQLVKMVKLGFISERVYVQKGKMAEVDITTMDGTRMDLDYSLLCKSSDHKMVLKQKGNKVVSDQVNIENGIYDLDCESKQIPNQPIRLIVQSEVSILQSGLIISTNSNMRQFQSMKPEYSADQNDMIQLQVTLDRPDINQIYFRVVHPVYSNTTKYMALQKDKSDQKKYVGFYDLGDPNNLLNIDGKYSLQLLISDPTVIKPITKQLTTIHIKYKKPLTGLAINKIINGLSYYGKQEIHHTFQSEHVFNKQIISYVVMVIMVIGLLVYISSGNCGRMKQKGILIQSLWMLNMVAWAALLLLFWIQINLLQYLGYAVGLVIITLFIGNTALSKLNE